MRGFLLLAAAIVGCYCITNAQDYNKGETVESIGPIPVEFRTLSSEKYKKQTASSIQKKDKAKVKKSKRNFLLESNFAFDELLISGKVLFNDPISLYINKVASNIIGKDKNLKDSLRFYVIKSPVVNAISTNQGYIMVNIGLLAQLENEAQLAFVLCHEIVHFKRKHSINKYVKMETSKGQFRKMSFEERLLSKAAYSKEHETQADMEGLEMFLKTDYSKEVLGGVFDVLEYGHLPYDEIDFTAKIFESEGFKLRNDQIIKECQAIKASDEDDTLSTHPSIKKRRVLVQNRIVGFKGPSTTKKFISGEDEFKKIRQLCRLEQSRLFTENKNYGASLYNSFLLLKENPKSKYAKEQILYALYFTTKYKNRSGDSDVITDYEKVQGKSQAIYYMLSKLSAKELNVMTLLYAWRLRNEMNGDKVIDRICKDLFNELVKENDMKPSDFFLSNPNEIKKKDYKKITDSLKAINPANLSKYEKIKFNSESSDAAREGTDTSDIIKYAFAEFYKDKDFVTYFNASVSDNKKRKELDESETEKKRIAKEERRNRKKGYALGLDRIIVVDPDFARIDERKKKSVRYLDAEEGQLGFNQHVNNLSQKLHFDLEVFAPMGLKSTDIEKFNDHALLNSWITERFEHDFTYVSLYQRDIEELTKKRKTENFAWMGAVAYTERKPFPLLLLLLSASFYPTIPFTIAYALTPDHSTFYYSMVFNVKSGDLVMKEFNKIDMNDSETVMKSNIYNTIAQFKNKRK